MFGKFVFNVSEKFNKVIEDNQDPITKYFALCVASKDELTR